MPNLIVETAGRTPADLGQLIYFFEYACGLSGYLLDVNPFDQPGVEAYKKNMFALLGKPGYEDRRAQLRASWRGDPAFGRAQSRPATDAASSVFAEQKPWDGAASAAAACSDRGPHAARAAWGGPAGTAGEQAGEVIRRLGGRSPAPPRMRRQAFCGAKPWDVAALPPRKRHLLSIANMNKE